jgi:hypothetical protein
VNRGRRLLGYSEIDFREVYNESYDEQVLMLLRYLAKHLGCRIADDGYPVPDTLKMAFVERDLAPFGVSFAVNSQWVNAPGAESVLVNHPLIAVRDLESGQILGPYMSGFSLGYLTIVYRCDFPIYLPWEGELISRPRQFVQLGRYEPDDNIVFRIGNQDYKIPFLSEQQRHHIFEQRPHDKMSNEERLDAWLNGVYLILSLGYPKLTKEELMKNLTIPLCEKIWYTTFSLNQIFP